MDSGALTALARDDRRAKAYLQEALARRIVIEIPAVVLAESTRGTLRDASAERIIKLAAAITPATERIARLAGRLLHAARSKKTIDALVAAEACMKDATLLLTSDVRDLRSLTATAPGVAVVSV